MSVAFCFMVGMTEPSMRLYVVVNQKQALKFRTCTPHCTFSEEQQIRSYPNYSKISQPILISY